MQRWGAGSTAASIAPPTPEAGPRYHINPQTICGEKGLELQPQFCDEITIGPTPSRITLRATSGVRRIVCGRSCQRARQACTSCLLRQRTWPRYDRQSYRTAQYARVQSVRHLVRSFC